MFTAGLNGAIAVQRAIDNTTQNITNASNPAYHRLETHFADMPVMSGAVSHAHRVEDTALEMRYQAAIHEYSTNEASKDSAEQLSAEFDASSLKKAYQEFLSASQEFSVNPNAEHMFKAAGENLSGVMKDFEANLARSKQQLKTQIASSEQEIELIGKEIDKLKQQNDSPDVANQISYLQLQSRMIAGKRDGYARTLGEIYPPVENLYGKAIESLKTKVNDSYGKELFSDDMVFNYQPGNVGNLNNALTTSFMSDVDASHQYVAERAHGMGHSLESSEAIKNGLEKTLQDRVGVNTEREMVKLLQYKNQYEAIMKAIATKDSMIGSLLAIV